MKKRNLILSCLLVTGLIGDMAVADNNTTVENNSSIVRGTTIGHYQKPGAPIDIAIAQTGGLDYIRCTLT